MKAAYTWVAWSGEVNRPPPERQSLLQPLRLISDRRPARSIPHGTQALRREEDRPMSFKKLALQGVYFVRAGDAVKVGWSGHVGRRLELIATDNSQPIELLNVYLTEDRNAERRLHALLRPLHIHREWYNARGLRTVGEWYDDFARALSIVPGKWLYPLRGAPA